MRVILPLAVLGLALFAGPSAPAQTPTFPRPDTTKINTSSFRTQGRFTDIAPGQLHFACPREVASAAKAGFHDTPLLAYAVWVEKYGGFDYVRFIRSVNGGLTWSAPNTIYTQKTVNNTTYDFEQLHMAATYHKVYIAFTAGQALVGWPNEVFVIGSEDEGATWTKPLPVNTVTVGKGDADGVRIAASLGKAHLVWRFGLFSSGTTQLPNDIYYAGVEFLNGALKIYKPETRVNAGATISSYAVGHWDISADSACVAIAWVDPRVSGATNGNLYVAVSKTFGMDFGMPTNPEKAITAYDATTFRSSGRWYPDVEVSKKNVYLAWGDGSVTDQVGFAYSNDLGTTFSKPIHMNPGGTGFDAEQPHLAADGDTVVVGWHDDRDGNGNYSNSAFCAVDRTGGRGFATAVKEIRLDNPTILQTRCEYPRVAVKGDKIAILYEISKYFTASYGMEDVAFVTSTDGGITFNPRRFGTYRGSMQTGLVSGIDVNAPAIGMTSTGDVLAAWSDNRANSAHDLFISGFRMPLLRNLGGTNGMEVTDLLPIHNNNAALILITDKGTTPDPILSFLGGQIGWAPNFSLSIGPGLPVTTICLGFSCFIGQVKSGKANFPFAVGLGIFDAMCLGIDIGTGHMVWYTDPVTL